MLEVLQMRLEDWGFRVETADSAMVARKLIPRCLPDIVISDVIMPEVSGLELLAQLKAENAHRPVILITAHASVDIAVGAIKEGAQDFLTKPLDYTMLRAILEAAQIEIRQVEGSQELVSQLETGSEMGSTSFIGMSLPVLEIFRLVGAVADRIRPSSSMVRVEQERRWWPASYTKGVTEEASLSLRSQVAAHIGPSRRLSRQRADMLN